MPLTAFEDPFEGYRLWRFTELSATPSATARSTPSEETKSKCSQVAEFHFSTTPFRSTRFGCFLQETLNNVTITFRTTNALSSAGFIAIQAHSFSLKMKCPYAFSLKKLLVSLGHLLVFRTLSQRFSRCLSVLKRLDALNRAGAIWLPHPHSLSSFIGGYSGRSAAHEKQIR